MSDAAVMAQELVQGFAKKVQPGETRPGRQIRKVARELGKQGLSKAHSKVKCAWYRECSEKTYFLLERAIDRWHAGERQKLIGQLASTQEVLNATNPDSNRDAIELLSEALRLLQRTPGSAGREA